MYSSLKIAIRTLAKSPAFSIISIVTLALGVGLNTAMFSIVNSLFFRAAPFPESGQLVQILDVTPQFNFGRFSVQDLDDLRRHSPNFTSVTSWTGWQYSLAEPGQPAEKLQCICVSKEFFDTFRVQPMLGRAFTPEEQVPGRNNVAILSHDFWQKQFGGQRDIVGKTIRLSTEPVTVIGVMPPGIEYPLLWGRTDIWRPITLPSFLVEPREKRYFSATARLKPGVTPAQAEAQLAPLATRLAKDFPEINKGHSFHVVPLAEAVADSTSRGFTLLLFGLSGFVLLIACANLANLQVARALAHAHDFAVRSALGASRGRLIRDQLLECIILSLAGGGAGLLVASWLMDLLERNLLIQNQPMLKLSLDPVVLSMTLLVSIFTGIIFGVAPAWFGSKVDVNTALKIQSRGSTSSRGSSRIRQTLIIVEIVMAVAYTPRSQCDACL
jgi:putative ABC transport system permease protein